MNEVELVAGLIKEYGAIGALLPIGLLLYKALFNDVPHLQKTLIEIKEVLVEIRDQSNSAAKRVEDIWDRVKEKE